CWCYRHKHDGCPSREMPKTPGTIPEGFAGARGQERAKALGCGLHSWTFVEWGTQVDRAACRSRGRGKRTSSTAVRGTKPVGVEAFVGTSGEAHDCGIGAGPCLGYRRYGLPQTREALGGSGKTIFGNARQGWELPGCGQPAPCWRTGQHGARLASVSAGKLDEGR